MNRVQVLEKQVAPASTSPGVSLIALDHPPLNALNHATRVHLIQAIKAANADPSIEFIVITGTGKAFSSGADISEFSAEAMKEPYLPEAIDCVEASVKPVIAAVNGMALGGGCELALACHYRVASSNAFFSLPEIKLGIIPGAGGTQRLPRCIGIQEAIQMACSGKNVKALPSLKLGLVDKVAGDPSTIVNDAIAFGKELKAKNKLRVRRLSEDRSKLGNCLTNAFVFRMARSQLKKTVPVGMVSPFKCLDAIEAAASAASFQEGLGVERKIFMECAHTPQAAAMQHFFFAQRAALKIPGVPKGTPGRVVNRVGVVGGGTMGGGIAMCCLNAGIPTTILETSTERRDFAQDTIRKNYAASVAKKRLTPELLETRMKLLTVVVNDYSAFQDCDYVIEAVFESMALKKEVFTMLNKVCKPTCVLASNTSTLSIDEIASVTSRPECVIGAHFFSPANVMPLLEFVRGSKTSPETILTSLDLGKRIRKVPVVVGNCFGFVSNRMIMRAGFQAMAMLEEGVFPREIDSVIKRYGFPMGPCAMQDLAGLDVGSKIRKETPKEFIPPRDVSTIPEALVAMQRLGQKSGKGWYLYDPQDAKRTPIPDNMVEKLIVKISNEKKITRRMVSKAEMEERYILALINEAANILLEGYAIRPSDIDIVYIFGFGFPPYKGGPCHYADFLGIENVVKKMAMYHKALGADTFPEPSPLLQRMVAEKRKFADLNKE